MVYATVVEDHVHYNLDAALVDFLNQLAVFLIGAEAGIYFVIIGRGIAVVASSLHVVFQYGSEPQSGYAQVGEVVQVLFDTGQVTAVAGVRVIAVYFGIQHAFYLVIVRIAVGKAVGHQQIEGIRSVESFMVAALHGSFLQFVFLHGLFLALCEREGHFSGLHILFQFQVDQKIVVAFQLHGAAHSYTGIIYCDACIADTFSVDHQLQFRVLHASVPEGRIDLVDVGCCVGGEGQQHRPK